MLAKVVNVFHEMRKTEEMLVIDTFVRRLTYFILPDTVIFRHITDYSA